jgi:hypothetical protein
MAAFDLDVLSNGGGGAFDLSLATAGNQTITAGQATETNLAQSITVVLGALVISLGQAAEFDAAQTITPLSGARVIAVGQVTEIDAAQAITPANLVVLVVDKMFSLIHKRFEKKSVITRHEAKISAITKRIILASKLK